MKKVYFLSYAQIRCGRFSNSSYAGFIEAAEKLSDDYQFYFTYTDVLSSNIKSTPRFLFFFNKVILFLSRKLNIPYCISRSVSESIFDRYYAHVLKKEKGDYTLILALYAPLSAKVAKRKNCKTVLLAGNHDDNLYYKTVREEKKRLNLSYTDVYDSNFRNAIYNRMMKNVDGIIVSNKLVADLFPSRLEKYQVLNTFKPNGYRKKSVCYNGGRKFIIGYIGHTVLLKGLHILAEAIQLSGEEIELNICGNVDPHVRALIDKYDVDVHYLGFVPDNEVNDFYINCDLIVVPSLYDAGPNTVLEAEECNVPVILSSGCGWSEYFENKKTHVFKTGDPQDLKNKIMYAMNHYMEFVRDTEEVWNVILENKQEGRLPIIDIFKKLAE